MQSWCFYQTFHGIRTFYSFIVIHEFEALSLKIGGHGIWKLLVVSWLVILKKLSMMLCYQIVRWLLGRIGFYLGKSILCIGEFVWIDYQFALTW